MPKVPTKVLVWARETAGLSEEEAAKRLNLSGADALKTFEAGEREPSRRQLVTMAGIYRRPLLTFYLPAPPRESDKGRDFRTLPAGRSVGSEALLNALLRNVQARQGLVRAALEEAEEDEPLLFVDSSCMSQGVDTLVGSMQDVLGFTAEAFRARKSLDEAFSALRAATEKAGVFVLLMGNLGTHHTDLDARTLSRLRSGRHCCALYRY